jgi:UDP-perosamine 4-acetyltransferase
VRAVVYGSRADGHAGVVVELFGVGAGLELVGLVDDRPENRGNRVGSLAVVGDRGALPRLATEGVEAVVLGFGAARGRGAAVAAVEAAGLALPVLVHSAAFAAPSAHLGAGCQLLPGAVVGVGAQLGAGVLVNSGAIVEHGSRVGAGVVIDPGAVLAGRVTAEAEAEIGSGAAVRPDVRIGAGAVVGAGAAVVSDVAAGATVVGVPARALGGSAQSG